MPESGAGVERAGRRERRRGARLETHPAKAAVVCDAHEMLDHRPPDPASPCALGSVHGLQLHVALVELFQSREAEVALQQLADVRRQWIVDRDLASRQDRTLPSGRLS